MRPKRYKTGPTVLKHARDLVKDGGFWVRLASALNEDGYEVDANDEDAVAFSALGAVIAMCDTVELTEQLVLALNEACQDLYGARLIDVNDGHRTNNKGFILEILDKDIAQVQTVMVFDHVIRQLERAR